MKTKNFFSRTGQFFKRNAYYVVLFVCIAGIATMITIVALNGSTPPDNNIIDNNPPPVVGEEDKDTDTKPIQFIMPVANFEPGWEYSGTSFIEYTTVGMWKTHTGIDFLADEGAEVKAVYDGVVMSINTDPYFGTVITIKINDELSTVYKSVTANSVLKSGDRVKSGDVIGYVANNLSTELCQGPHLHLEVLLNGKFTDPANYFELDEK